MMKQHEIKIKLCRAVHRALMSRNGIALIMVLWVLAILMAIVFSFSYTARTETSSALSFRQNSAHKFLSEAGFEHAVVELLYHMNNPVLEDTEPIRMDGTAYEYKTSGGSYSFSIMDESGKVDLNKAPEVLLRTMFSHFVSEDEDADSIVDSLLDWRDADDLYRLHGAENDYYQSLPNPYEAKNADFETVEELILVKGVTSGLLYGGPERRGIIDFLTVHSPSGTINITSAPREVLLSVPGMTSDIADAIIASRASEDTEQLEGIVGLDIAAFSSYAVSGTGGNTFTIDAVGYGTVDQSGYATRATVSIQRHGEIQYHYYKSPLELRNVRINNN
jgi:general secretion pathway protein K